MHLDISPRIQQALNQGQPIVALETTVITHGLDHPDNLEVALAMEQAIADAGACPATLGIVAGRVVVGMDNEQIGRFATAGKNAIAKCSRRDLPVLVATGQDGSLTVAGTMVVAHAGGIHIMATGGIGGVHLGHPFDVSADLDELARTPVAVVCSGIKSILDMPNTLEVLESRGVAVVGMGTTTLPAFFYADSGLALPATTKDAGTAGTILSVWRALELGSGLLLTVPVPAKAALQEAEANSAIRQALADADASEITGSAVTPFVLKRVAELTHGRSVVANKALLINNARVAAEVALAGGHQAAMKQ